MYSKIFKSKKIRISNAHYKKLLERFDKNKFVEKLNSPIYQLPTMVNSTPCALCKSFFKRGAREKCGKCPMAIFGHEYYLGCTYITYKLLKASDILISMGNVTYRCIDSRRAIRSLEAITDFLKSFEKE